MSDALEDSDADRSRQRVDKWLWFARIVKSRTLAQKIVAAGRVRINRERENSASHLVKVGDTLTVTLEAGVRVLRVTATGMRRGPATEARLLYEDLSPPSISPELGSTEPRDTGRPTKHGRRAIAALKRGGSEFSKS